MKMIGNAWIKVPMLYRFIIIFGAISIFSFVTIVSQTSAGIRGESSTISVVMAVLTIMFSITFFLLAPSTLFAPIRRFSKLAIHLSRGNLQDDQMIKIACPDMNGLSTNLALVVQNLRSLVSEIKANSEAINQSFTVLITMLMAK